MRGPAVMRRQANQAFPRDRPKSAPKGFRRRCHRSEHRCHGGKHRLDEVSGGGMLGGAQRRPQAALPPLWPARVLARNGQREGPQTLQWPRRLSPAQEIYQCRYNLPGNKACVRYCRRNHRFRFRSRCRCLSRIPQYRRPGAKGPELHSNLLHLFLHRRKPADDGTSFFSNTRGRIVCSSRKSMLRGEWCSALRAVLMCSLRCVPVLHRDSAHRVERRRGGRARLPADR